MSASDSYPLGEQAHIVAEEQDGPRGESSMPRDERNRYHNLILLCPTDHTIIDKDVRGYPVEKLHMLKTDHELWVRTQLADGELDSQRAVAQQTYASLIDRAVIACGFADWYNWTSWALAAEPRWSVERAEAIRDFRRSIFGAVWPGRHIELETALRHLSRVLSNAAETFRKHAEYDPGEKFIRADRFYRHAPSDAQYHAQGDAFTKWLTECHELVFEATKAANWFADCVRRYVNPMFFAIEGVFIVAYESGFTVENLRLEYSAAERDELIRKYEVE